MIGPYVNHDPKIPKMHKKFPYKFFTVMTTNVRLEKKIKGCFSREMIKENDFYNGESVTELNDHHC